MPTGYRVTTVAENAGTKSCRRPLKVGRYDATAERTFVCWMGADCDVFVAAFDHTTDTWSEPKRVGESFEDYHNYPHLIQTADGYLHLLYGCHNTPLKQATSASPHSIEGDWQDRSLDAAPDATYPMPFRTTDEEVFVFYRRTDDVDDRPLAYVRSTDHGRTWTNSVDLTGASLAIGHTDRPDNMDEIYAGQLKYETTRQGSPDRVHIVWTLAGGGEEGREHNRYHRNLYYARFHPGSLTFRGVDGADLGPSIGRQGSEDHCKVLDTGPPEGLDVGYIQYVHVTAAGRPLLVFDSVLEVCTATWTGEDWAFGTGPDGGFADGVLDIERIGAETFRVYARGDEGIQVFESEDAGRTWRRSDRITLPVSVLRAVVIDDYRDPARLLAREASDWDSFVTDRDIVAVGRASE